MGRLFFTAALEWNLTLFLVVIEIFGAHALKDVKVNIPVAAKVMDTVTLQCEYDLEGEPLYTVKWYKGTKEFYRYIPKELPSTLVFPLPGIDIDLNKSSYQQVVLRNIQPEVTGKYKCEVSTDAPNFYTAMMSGYMYVVEVPEEEPVLQIGTLLYEYRRLLKGNCSAPASYPSANITWLLNGKKMPEHHSDRITVVNPYASHTNRRLPVKTLSSIELNMSPDTFQGGIARLTCVATIFNLYKKEKEIILEEERPTPRPSSVLGTRDATSGSTSWTAIWNWLTPLFVLPVLQGILR